MLDMNRVVKFGCLAAVTSVLLTGAAFADAMMAKKGGSANIVLLPKFLGILPFDQANRGAQEAHKAVSYTHLTLPTILRV